MPPIHLCRDKNGELVQRSLDLQGVCQFCRTICKEHSAAEILVQKAAYEAKGGTWGLNPTGGEKP